MDELNILRTTLLSTVANSPTTVEDKLVALYAAVAEVESAIELSDRLCGCIVLPITRV